VAYTIVVVHSADDEGELHRRRVYLSQEYLPHKERDESGALLPNQEWQHPEPSELHHCDVGMLNGDQRAMQLIEVILNLGTGQTGRHGRMLTLESCPWIEERLETWVDRQAQVEEEQAAEERRRYAEEMARAPVYGYCERCARETEQCKGPQHRGRNRYMACGGGLGESRNRVCVNCVDLPYREKREQALGHPIVYSGEDLDSD